MNNPPGSLRIGLVAPPWFSVPPRGYGGIERVVSYLADGLSARGHRVTLFAPGGSRSLAEIHSTYLEPPSAKLGSPAVEAVHLLDAFSRWREFDVIHDHTSLGLLAGANLPTPLVHTVHGTVNDDLAAFYRQAGRTVSFVTISRNQASTLPRGIATTTIPNALDVEARPFSATPGDYLLWVGRMCPEKGVLNAIEIARRSGRRLVMVGKVNEAPEKAYFDDVVTPALRGIDVDLRHDASQADLDELYGGALATLFPIEWEEPFGLVMIESMAAGTPVIAFKRGAVPEVIVDGVTGFVCDGIESATAAVERAHLLDRGACRSHVAQRFSVGGAVRAHEVLYHSVTKVNSPPLTRIA